MRRVVLAPLTLIVLAACQPTTTELTDEQEAAIADTVRQLADTYVGDLRALNFDRMMASYASEIVVAENGVLGANRDSLLTAWRSGFASFREVTNADWREVHVKVLGPAAAVLTGSWTSAWVDTAGVALGARGVWTGVWERGTEGWKIVYSHESYLPTPESM